MKATIITLTIASLLLIPSVESWTNGNSSERQVFTSSVLDNFDALEGGKPDFYREYDFQSFSPDFAQILEDFINNMSELANDGLNLWNNTVSFFTDPFDLDSVEIDLNRMFILFNIFNDVCDYWLDEDITNDARNTYLSWWQSSGLLVQISYYSPTTLATCS
jgi:hypothetical protein